VNQDGPTRQRRQVVRERFDGRFEGGVQGDRVSAAASSRSISRWRTTRARWATRGRILAAAMGEPNAWNVISAAPGATRSE
jgi:hypothetical protein